MDENEIVFEKYIAELKEIFGDSSIEMKEIVEDIKKYKDLTKQKEDLKKSNKYDDKIDELHESISETSGEIIKKFKEQKDLASEKEMAQNDDILNDPLLLSSYEYDKSSLSNDILNLNDEIKEKNSKIEVEEKKKELFERNLDREIKKVYSKLESEIEKISKKISEKIEENKNTYIPSTKKIDEIKTEIENKKSDILSLNENGEKLKQQLQNSEKLALDKIDELRKTVLGEKPESLSMDMYMHLDSIKLEIESAKKQIKENELKIENVKNEIKNFESEKTKLEGKKDLQQKDNRNKYISLLYIKDDINLENINYVENLFEDYLKYTGEENLEEVKEDVINQEEKIEDKIEQEENKTESEVIDDKEDENKVEESNSSTNKDDITEKYGNILNFQSELRSFRDIFKKYKITEENIKAYERNISGLFAKNYDGRILPTEMSKDVYKKLSEFADAYLDIKEYNDVVELDTDIQKFNAFLEKYFGEVREDLEQEVENEEKTESEFEKIEEAEVIESAKAEEIKSEEVKQEEQPQEIIEINEDEIIEEPDYELDSDNVISEDDYIDEKDYSSEFSLDEIDESKLSKGRRNAIEWIKSKLKAIEEYKKYDYETYQLNGSKLPPLYMKLMYHQEEENAMRKINENLEKYSNEDSTERFTSKKGLISSLREIALNIAYKKSKGETGFFNHIKSIIKKPTKQEKEGIRKMVEEDGMNMLLGVVPKTKYVSRAQSTSRNKAKQIQACYTELYKAEEYEIINNILKPRLKELDEMNDFDIRFLPGEYYKGKDGNLVKVTNPKGEIHKVKIEDVRKELEKVKEKIEKMKDTKIEKLHKEQDDEKDIDDYTL